MKHIPLKCQSRETLLSIGCGCDGAFDDGCPICTPDKFKHDTYQWCKDCDPEAENVY
jgi:hypothetical protein